MHILIKGGIFVIKIRRLFIRHKKFKLYTYVLFFILITWGFFSYVEKRLTPNILAIAEARTRVLATEAINKAIKEKIAKNVQYKDFISIHKDTSGQVTLIQVNTVEINRLESETALEVVKTLQEVTIDGLNLPLGIVTGSKILSNYGPSIKVKLVPVGTAEVNMVESFQEAGINQTRHRIVLEITATVQIVQPLLKSAITIRNDVPVAETIIIGNVPNAILNLK